MVLVLIDDGGALGVRLLSEILERISTVPVCGYRSGGVAATEPTALAAMALIGHGRPEPAKPAQDWLDRCQNQDGSLGVSQTEAKPRWPTSLAVLAWLSDPARGHAGTERALAWILGARGRAMETPDEIGHDTTIVAWSWVEDTHSWVEPTALHVLALKAAGHGDHPRTRDGVRMLRDRLLSTGGSNCGNTIVLGQTLRPHLMPTGLALLALSDESDDDGRIAFSLDYAERQVARKPTTASLAFALLGLAAHGRTPRATHLDLVAEQTLDRGASPYKLALIALAALGEDSPLVTLPKQALMQ